MLLPQWPLSLPIQLHERWRSEAATSDILGPYSNLLEPLHPLYNVVLDKFYTAHEFFSRKRPPCDLVFLAFDILTYFLVHVCCVYYNSIVHPALCYSTGAVDFELQLCLW
jgi:hypothetical protein